VGDRCLTRKCSDPGRGKTSEEPLPISGEARSLHVLVTAIALAMYEEYSAEEQAAVKGNSLLLWTYLCCQREQEAAVLKVVAWGGQDSGMWRQE